MRTTLLFFLFVVLAFAHAPANAQQPTKVPQIGYLNVHPAPNSRPLLEPFRQGLRELRYIEGSNIILHTRIGEVGRLKDLAAELVRLNVDVIVAPNLAPVRTAMNATKTLPIITTFNANPVLNRLVASFERPRWNVTGVYDLTLELGGKWLEIIKETIPSAKRIAVFWHRGAEETFPIWKSLDVTARSLQIELEWLEIIGPSYIARKFSSAVWSKADAFIVLPGFSGPYYVNLKEIARLGLKNRMPGIFWSTALAMDGFGGLMAYGANRADQMRRAAYMVDKILKGAKTADLPVEMPRSFELVINQKVANELGITIPPWVLAWADHVFR